MDEITTYHRLKRTVREDRIGMVRYRENLWLWSYIIEHIWNDIDPYDQFIMLYCTNYSMYACYDHVIWLIWMTYNEVLMIRYICYRWCCTIHYQLINFNAVTHSSNYYHMSESRRYLWKLSIEFHHAMKIHSIIFLLNYIWIEIM